MRRYIDADKIICRLNDEIVHGIDIDTHPVEFGTYLGLLSAKSIIESVLAADVQEVRHGHWIEKDLDNFRKVECSCSICGWSGVENYDSYVDIHDFEFCPYCGAKMDEEEQE